MSFKETYIILLGKIDNWNLTSTSPWQALSLASFSLFVEVPVRPVSGNKKGQEGPWREMRRVHANDSGRSKQVGFPEVTVFNIYNKVAQEPI